VHGIFSKTLSVHPTVNGYLARFGPGEGEGGKEEEWHLFSVTPLPVGVGSLTATSLTAINGYGINISCRHIP